MDGSDVANVEAEKRLPLAEVYGGRYADEIRASLTPSTPLVVAGQDVAVLAMVGDFDTARRELPRLDRADTSNTITSQRVFAAALLQANDHHAQDAIARLQAILARPCWA